MKIRLTSGVNRALLAFVPLGEALGLPVVHIAHPLQPGLADGPILEAPSDHRWPRDSLAATLTGGNRHDSTQLIPLVGSGLGTIRSVVERTFAWLHQYKRSAPATNAALTSTTDYSNSPAS